MKGFSTMIKRWDIIVTLVLVLLSFLPAAVFSYQQAEKTNGNYNQAHGEGLEGPRVTVAVISVNNEEVRRITLTGNTENEVFDVFSSDKDFNTVEVRGEEIRIKGANCSDQVCVQFGFLSKPGETAVCLPHNFIIELETVGGTVIEDEPIISS
ncbi:NusG domain II-containing protein [Bacillus tuaregi]|uniref:NusG domain II-containing protein n=1 Tax=Bacillus tuaregi TaxID=1816695 RepID=UPI0008F868DB|nr:NusG domain II-containing protein [Bacillus tuaregi]